MSLRIIIVEDELIVAEDIKMMLEFSGYSVVGIAFNYTEAVKMFQEEQIDLALLDVNLGGSKDGIDLAEYINKNYHVPIIYATSNTDKYTVSKAKTTYNSGYLVKPFRKEDLFTSIEMAIANYDNKNGLKDKDYPKTIFIKNGSLFVRVLVGEIVILKSEKNYTEVITCNKKYVVRGTVKTVLEELDPALFLRIHKSFVVNLDKIQAINSTYVIMEKEEEVPLGKVYKEELISKFKLLR